MYKRLYIAKQRPASSRCFKVFFVFEYLIYSSTTLNIMDMLGGCQRENVLKFTKPVYNFCQYVLRVYRRRAGRRGAFSLYTNAGCGHVLGVRPMHYIIFSELRKNS